MTLLRPRPLDRDHVSNYADPVRVVLAEDSFIARTGVIAVLEFAGLELAGVAANYDDLLKTVDDEQPDVVITDIRMPPTLTDEGIRAALHIRETHPDIGVVVMSQHLEADLALDLFDAGAAGLAYLLKERVGDARHLEEAVERVHRGDSMLDPLVVDSLVGARRSRSEDKIQRLTDREREVLTEVAAGKSNVATAAALDLSEGSVEKHIRTIFTKLDLLPEPETNRRVKAVLAFLDQRN